MHSFGRNFIVAAIVAHASAIELTANTADVTHLPPGWADKHPGEEFTQPEGALAAYAKWEDAPGKSPAFSSGGGEQPCTLQILPPGTLATYDRNGTIIL